MAKADSIATVQRTITALVDSALLIANEMNEEQGRQFSLASAITDQLVEHTVPRGLSEVLEERLADTAELLRLMDTLEGIKSASGETLDQREATMKK